MTDRAVTVLLTVYAGVRAPHLREALESVAAQTRVPDELVVVADGPLTPELEAVLATHRPACRSRLVRLPRNLGSGPASQAGMAAVTGDWVARADADDVSVPHRLERQLAALDEAQAAGRPLDVVGAAMTEFSDAGDLAGAGGGGPAGRQVLGVRRLPSGHDAIAAYLRINNPINNPTLLVRAQAVRAVGGYRAVPFMEDYDLMARLLAAGCRFANLDEPLVLFRMSGETIKRRTGARILQGEWQMQRNLQAYGITRGWQRCRNLVLRLGFRLLPSGLLNRAYSALFRR